MTTDIVASMKEGPMRPVQVLAVTICVVINMIDGFDVLVMAFTASSIAAEWSLQPQSVGILLSSGLFGMAAGSLFLAPIADKIGRRNTILVCLVIISGGMLASAFTWSMSSLASARVVTGIGIGGMLASITTITAEYSSHKRQGFAISMVQSGYPVGATIGGTIAAFLIVAYGWRSVYVFGAACTVVMIPLVLRYLPESLEYLIERKPRNALEKVNQLLDKLGMDQIAELPASQRTGNAAGVGVLELVSAPLRTSTLLLWCAFFMVMLSFYFVLSWTPTLLTEAGLRAEQGISGGVLMNIGGVVGGVTLGYLTARFSRHRLTALYMVLCAVFMALFGLLDGNLGVMLVLGFVIGYFIFGSIIGVYSIAPNIYSTIVRNTGMGWASGGGRFGGIIGPSAAGFLLAQGWTGAQCFYAFGIPLLIAMAAVLLLKAQQTPSLQPA
ncbi:MAG: MFS transporter [Gammaproteobacteria bacterium]|nr:MFS transporter [Gammaproteobacteria bacterium]